METTAQQAFAATAGQTIALGGNDYAVKMKWIEDYAVIDAAVVAHRGSPFDLLNELPQKLQGNTGAIQAAARGITEGCRNWKFVTSDEHNDFVNSFDGFLVCVWLGIRHNDPKSLTRNSVARLVCEELEREFKKGGMEAVKQRKNQIEAMLQQVNGEDALGN